MLPARLFQDTHSEGPWSYLVGDFERSERDDGAERRKCFFSCVRRRRRKRLQKKEGGKSRMNGRFPPLFRSSLAVSVIGWRKEEL